MELAEKALSGDRRALARLLTVVENGGPAARQALRILYPHTGQAHLIGITGAPGTGKSTLVNEIAKVYRARDKRVAVIAVDPTSPFSGGAILGDRVRMNDLAGDPGVFVRSMASRGNLGGLARTSADMIKVMDAAGFDVVLVETVGAGQSEVAIASTAHSVVVVEAPGLGDEVQVIKAGILEIADVFAVNKSDRQGADRAAAALAMMLDLGQDGPPRYLVHHGALMEIALGSGETASTDGWRPPICLTSAIRGQGVEELVDALTGHRAYLEQSGELARRERARLASELEHLLRDQMMEQLLHDVDRTQLATLLEQVVRRGVDPYQAVQQLLGA
ncbi:MAG: methylmalonyl Co-A mutase-associated GTPase MeaB [Anaerolineae bacterium]